MMDKVANQVSSPMSLLHYAMSGTDVPYIAICLRARYTMSGTGIPYVAICLRARYAISGTDVVYGVPVDWRYCHVACS
eukprot:113604-Rhodomonas_salina.3